METALITFRQPRDAFYSDKISDIIDLFNGYNFVIGAVLTLSGENKKEFFEKFNILRQTYGNIIVLNSEYNTFEMSDVFENFVKMNYVYDDDGFSVILLDGSFRYREVLEQKFIPHLQEKYGRKFGKVVFKLYGVPSSKLGAVVDEINGLTGGNVIFNITENGGDYKAELIYDNTSGKMAVDDAQKKFISVFRDYIYAEYDVTLEQRLVDILKFRNLVLSSAESFTGGNIARSIVGIPGASDVFYEGIVSYGIEAKKKRLNVKQETLAKFKAVSAEVAYEMCAGLMTEGVCDVAVSTTGIAGPTSDSSNFPVGLCYIAVGFGKDIHVRKYNFTGSREEIIDKGTKTAMFLAVNAIKNI